VNKANEQTAWNPLTATKGVSRIFYAGVTASWIAEKGYLKYIEGLSENDVKESLGENLSELDDNEQDRVQANRDYCIAETHQVCQLPNYAIDLSFLMPFQRIANWYQYTYRTKKRDASNLPAVQEVLKMIRTILKPNRKLYDYRRYGKMFATKLASALEEAVKNAPPEDFLKTRESFLKTAFENENPEV
jgi:hypothetical protein